MLAEKGLALSRSARAHVERSRVVRLANCSLLLCLASAVCIATEVRADLPNDRVVCFAIHSDPTNPSSRVQYVLALSISAQQQDGNWIGWQIDNYRITERAILGSDATWDIDFPFVSTADGLWWVEHDDPSAPKRSEFLLPPGVADTAIANDPGDPDLAFDVVGVSYVEPPEGAPYEYTAALDFSFSTTADPNDPPDDSGNDEPVDGADLPEPGPTAQ